jgi:hypothetical protein
MEWLFSGLFALVVLIWAGIFLITKFLRLRPIAEQFQEQMKLVDQARASVPELTKFANALADDPAIHVARRLEIQRETRKRKRERSRRLISRVF